MSGFPLSIRLSACWNCMPVDGGPKDQMEIQECLAGREKTTGNNAVKLCVQTILTSQGRIRIMT
jgi:hypothetical protein